MTNEVADGQMTQENGLSAMFQVTSPGGARMARWHDGTEQTEERSKNHNENTTRQTVQEGFVLSP